ncbi:MAG: S1C family serine protease [Candidatus Bathyarchaeota archaeon]|nr:S1C family serine protease [Candidatus Bathyarchaeota archaeon]
MTFTALTGVSDVYAQSSQEVAVQPQVTEEISISQLYDDVRNSVVVITDVQPSSTGFGPSYTSVQGSGFVYDFDGRMVVITNYHVVSNAVNISVTFRNGNGYAATVLGSDPYADLAVLSADAPAEEFQPLELVSSSSLSVGGFCGCGGQSVWFVRFNNNGYS